MREEVLASSGAQDVDSSGYELSDLEDIELFWENPQLEFDAVLRPGMDNRFLPTAFSELEMVGGSSKNPIVLDETDDKNNSPQTPLSERLTELPRLLRSLLFGGRNKKVPKSVHRALLEQVYSILGRLNLIDWSETWHTVPNAILLHWGEPCLNALG